MRINNTQSESNNNMLDMLPRIHNKKKQILEEHWTISKNYFSVFLIEINRK